MKTRNDMTTRELAEFFVCHMCLENKSKLSDRGLYEAKTIVTRLLF